VLGLVEYPIPRPGLQHAVRVDIFAVYSANDERLAEVRVEEEALLEDLTVELLHLYLLALVLVGLGWWHGALLALL
jgi:hypothetical protein